MPSPNEMPPIAPAPQNLTNETKASMAAALRAANFPEDAIKAAGYDPAFTPAPQPAPQVNSNIRVTSVAPGVSYMSGDGITHDQAIASGKDLIARGVDPGVVAEAVKAYGVTEAELNYQPPSKEAIAQAHADAQLHASMQVPQAASEYEITYNRGFAEAMDITELQAFDVEARKAMQAAGVPRSMAQGFVEAIIDTGEIYASESMTDAGKQLRWKEEGALFRRMSQNIDEDVRLAALAYNAFPKEYRDILDNNYALHSARAQLMLANLGRAMEYRAGKTKGK